MDSLEETHSELDFATPALSATASTSALPNAFGRMMQGSSNTTKSIHLRDRCKRPTPAYNFNYDPMKAPSRDLPNSYSPYVFGEPLFDDRPVIISRLPTGHIVAGASKRPRTSWVWNMGYVLKDTSKASQPTVWACHHDPEFSRNKTWHFNSNTLNNAETHLREVHFRDEGGDIWRKQPGIEQAQASGLVDGSYERVIPFRQQEFVNAFLEWMIMDNIKLRKACSKRLKRAFKIANMQAANALPASGSTAGAWVEQMFKYFEPEVQEEVRMAKSCIHVSFDGWGSKHEKLSVLGVVIHFINAKYEVVTRLIGLPELPGHGKAGADQARVLLPLLQRFGITNDNLGYFVLDNASNNDTTLVELAIELGFDPIIKRLRCMGHILNLIAEAYLFGQDISNFEESFKKASPKERRKLWRDRGELGKLHNLIAHICASGKRTDLFMALQTDVNVGIAEGKRWKLLLDGGIRWNASYLMIRRALELQEALDIYATKLRVSTDILDEETYSQDYLTPIEWDALELIKNQLEPLFYITKSLEGNADLQDGACKASHGALWEILPTFEFILSHFESLENRAKAGEFHGHPGIQSSITLAWNTTKKWYSKTDQSVAWVAGVVLHPRFKFKWFDDKWTSAGEARALASSKTKLRRLWENSYKLDNNLGTVERSPEPMEKESYLERILNQQAPTSISRVTRPSLRKDELYLYLQEPPTDLVGFMEYWRAREADWPHLASMAFDFMSIPAMSSECERVFSSCGKITTPECSRLSGKMLWQLECLKNWQRRGAIKMESFKNAVLLDLD